MSDPGSVVSPEGMSAGASAQASGPPRRRLTDGADFPVLPDCCNLGTMVRVLLPLNLGVVLLGWLLPAAGVDYWPMLETALRVDAVAAASLLTLCPLRRSVNGAPRWVQWVVGLGVPSAFAIVVAVGSAEPPAPGVAAFAAWLMPRVLLAAGIAWALIEYLRLRQLSLQPSQAEGRLQALQARIRPHFLFNSLNTVLGLMRSDPRKAERTLENLADLFRVFMKDSRELVPLDDEVLLCKEYLTIEKLRLADRLGVRWELDGMPGDALLPSLLLQPLVENAVHHGIEPNQEPGEIRVSIAKSGDRVRVEIANPLPDAPPTRPGNHMALSNVRERLDLTFDVEGQLETSSADGQFRVIVQFPYRKERRRRDARRPFDPDR
ncbi:MAG: histidine kinase [Burkholderiaceae bacterium]|jgi:two-component system sensor histidine kinase AlgZ|nr:histidine kinase [Burkholderiaceae bacterium]HMN65263.1 histidine kinase [Burkholderiaceae bacterium]